MRRVAPISALYAYPTCSLEVWVKPPYSPKIGSAGLEFRLSLTALPDRDHELLQLQGNSTQLETLATVVEAYIEEFLSPTPLPLGAQTPLPSQSTFAAELTSPAELTSSEAGAFAQFEPLTDPSPDSPLPAAILGNEFASDIEAEMIEPAGFAGSGSGWATDLDSEAEPDIYLCPQTLLHHELHLGSLATKPEQSVVCLPVSQLFDLSSALAAWWTEREQLSVAAPAPPRRVLPLPWKRAPLWLRSTAIAALVVGVTTTALRVAQHPLYPSDKREVSLSTAPPPPPPPQALTIPSPPPQTIAPGTKPQVPLVTPTPGQSRPAAPTDTPPTVILSPPQPLPVPPAPPLVATEPFAAQDNNRVSDSSPTSQRWQKSTENEAGVPSAQTDTEVLSPQERAELQGGITASPASPLAASPPALSQAPSRRSPPIAVGNLSQVAEVQAYFARRWQPPPELPQTIEYTLILNPDGSLQRTIPLSKTAATFVDRTPLPLANEPFVSALKTPSNPRIRLVLEKSGKVQAFLEGFN
uniref:DUF4335 domain-containing protein n=1 Tax=Cyanothece sp. (strain PCC 7425 / ATCC 29141) TaxID=395961 RepID=B8HP82_CYAP4